MATRHTRTAGFPAAGDALRASKASLYRTELRDLLKVAGESLAFSPPNYLRSVFGPPSSWLPPYRRYSEYNILNPWRMITAVRYILDVSVPATARPTPDWARNFLPGLFNRRIWRPTTYFRQPDPYGGVSSFPDEHWFFINGITTNHDMATINAEYLAQLFHRPLTVIQNSTDSFLVDLVQCAIGKGFKTTPVFQDRHTMTEPTWWAVPAVLEALNAEQTRRVIILAHSQGTIIVANVLRAVTGALEVTSRMTRSTEMNWHPFAEQLMGMEAGAQTMTQKIQRDHLAHALTDFAPTHPQAIENLKKLEIYTFANCADQMRYVDRDLPVPYLEHFANEYDLVARLGILSPYRDSSPPLIGIDGPAFQRPDAWGHFLNAHYLSLMDEYLFAKQSRTPARDTDNPYQPLGDTPGTRPRLYDYFHGERAPPATHP